MFLNPGSFIILIDHCYLISFFYFQLLFPASFISREDSRVFPLPLYQLRSE